MNGGFAKDDTSASLIQPVAFYQREARSIKKKKKNPYARPSIRGAAALAAGLLRFRDGTQAVGPKCLVVPRVESPREKEPPAVEIGGGKLPSCTSYPRPRRSSTLARLGPNVRRHPSVPSAPPHGHPHLLCIAATADRVGSCHINTPSIRQIFLRMNFTYEERRDKEKKKRSSLFKFYRVL